MAGIINNPEKIRNFATIVRVHSQDIETKKNLLKSQLKRLHEDWRDNKYNAFEKKFCKIFFSYLFKL